MPAFHRRDLAVRTAPVNFRSRAEDPLASTLELMRAYFEGMQALFDPKLMQDWERALERAWSPGLGSASLLQLLELSSEFRRRGRQRRDDTRRMVKAAVDSAAARVQQRTMAQRRRRHARVSRRGRDLAALMRTLRELPLRWLEASLLWPFTDDERARWLAFWRRLAGRRPPPAAQPEPPPRFDVFVQPDPAEVARRIAAARQLREALLEALRGLAYAERQLTAHAVERN